MNTCATYDDEGETVVGWKMFLHKWKLESGVSSLETGVSSEDLGVSILESGTEGEKHLNGRGK